MTVVHGRGKFSHLLRPCTWIPVQNNQAHSTKDNTTWLLYFTYFAQSVRHSIIPWGIVYTVPWSSSVAIVLWLYICNLLTYFLAREEQTGQDSMSSRHLKMLQSAVRHLTKSCLCRYTGSGAILVNAYLHIGICFQNCQFPLVKGVGKLSSKCAYILPKCIHGFHLQPTPLQLL